MAHTVLNGTISIVGSRCNVGYYEYKYPASNEKVQLSENYLANHKVNFLRSILQMSVYFLNVIVNWLNL